MEKTARLTFDGKTYEFPVVTGTEGEMAIDISTLRDRTGLITLDPGFVNTGSCKSAITFMDGTRGVLRHHGISIEELAENSTFVETAYLLINQRLPTRSELNAFSVLLNDQSLLHEDMRNFFQNFPRRAHPMGILSSMINALREFYPEIPVQSELEGINLTFARLLSKLRTMAAISYRISSGHKVVYPRYDLSYCANFLHMMFDAPVKPYVIDDELVRALNVFWILHADHEQNCSTAAVRLVGSARVNLYAAISAGLCALWGPLHGGANQAVIEMLQQIHDSGANTDTFIEKAKDKKDPFRLMGFGHRVYKTYDPRSTIMQRVVEKVLNRLEEQDPLLDIAQELKEKALKDPFFIDYNLYPNVDFYSGILLRAMRIPIKMFTVMFAIGRLPGWISQWKESRDDPDWKIHRPRQIYMGPQKQTYVPIDQRKEV